MSLTKKERFRTLRVCQLLVSYGFAFLIVFSLLRRTHPFLLPLPRHLGVEEETLEVRSVASSRLSFLAYAVVVFPIKMGQRSSIVPCLLSGDTLRSLLVGRSERVP